MLLLETFEGDNGYHYDSKNVGNDVGNDVCGAVVVIISRCHGYDDDSVDDDIKDNFDDGFSLCRPTDCL